MKLSGMFKKLFVGLYLSLKRFPVSLTLSAMATIIVIINIHGQEHLSQTQMETLIRIAMILALGIPITLSTKLVFERKKDLNIFPLLITYFTEAILLVLYFFFLLKNFEMVSITRYIAVSIAFYMAFMFIPYFFKRYGFELYIIRLFSRFFTTIIYSAVIFLGISAILFTIDSLLGVNVSEKIYWDIWVAIVGIFATSFFLGGLPLNNQQFESTSYPKIFKVLLLYIVMPIISAYTVILYIYFAKIIITHQWPQGMVTHLVLWYSLISTAVLFFITPLNNENNWSKVFSYWFPKIILPLIIMMFVSIGLRVNAYGVTESRYFVIVLSLWVFGIMIYLNLARTKRNIILPITISIIAILSVFGPWSSYSISKLSQNTRLQNILIKYNMINNDKIVKSNIDIPTSDKYEINQILKYFSYSHKLSDVKHLPKDFQLNQMETIFGFSENIDYNVIPPEAQRYFSYNSNVFGNPINIKGYDYLFTVEKFNSLSHKPDKDIEFKYDMKNNEVKILYKNKEIYKNNMKHLGNELFKRYGAHDSFDIPYEKVTFVDENNSVKIKFILQNLVGNYDKDSNDFKIDGMSFYVFFSVK